MTIVVDNPIALVIGLAPLAAFGYFIVRAQKARADAQQASQSDLSLATAQKETEIYRAQNERLQQALAERDTQNADLKSRLASQDADFKSKLLAQDKQIAELTALIRQDVVSPALVAILEKITASNVAQIQLAMGELKHYAESEFRAIQTQLDAILGTTKTYSETAERRKTS